MAVIVRITSADGKKVITQTLPNVPKAIEVPEGATVEVIDEASGRPIPVQARHDDDAPPRDNDDADANVARNADVDAPAIEIVTASSWPAAELALTGLAGQTMGGLGEAMDLVLADIATIDAASEDLTWQSANYGDGGTSALLYGALGLAALVGAVVLISDDDDNADGDNGGDGGDTVAPDAPTGLDLAAEDDDGDSDSDNITTITSGLTISGTAEADSSVEVLDGSTSLGTATADGSGAFSLDVDLGTGDHSLTATATDAAGNTSNASGALDISVIEPVAPVNLLNSSIDGAGDVVTLYFDGRLETPEIAPAVVNFQVNQGGDQAVNAVIVTGNRVVLHLDAPLAETGAVSVSFLGTGLTGADGGAVPAFSDVAITNRLDVMQSGAIEFDRSTGIALDGAEISAFDPESDRIFVTGSNGIQVIQMNDDLSLELLGTIAVGTNNITSVAVSNGIVAAAVAADPETDPGKVYFLDADGAVDASAILGDVDVGALPDMVTFTPDGNTVLVANEGERTETGDVTAENPLVDPVGSVSLIDISGGIGGASVQTAGFDAFNDQIDALRAEGVRLFAGLDGLEDLTVAQDLEPEYIAVSADGARALVTLQEANAVAVLDIASATIVDVQPLGLKSFDNLLLDLSDRDGGINLGETGGVDYANVFGQFMPDAIASFTSADGATYFVIANEGDDREDFFDPEPNGRGDDLTLDPTVFPNAASLQQDDALGRIGVTTLPGLNGDTDGDGDSDQILVYGGRSFSILNADGTIVFDSGSHIEQFVALGGLYDEDTNTGQFDEGRSDNKGPEPEGITTGVFGDSVLAFVALERGGGGMMVYDVTDPGNVEFVEYVRGINDISPEGLAYISAADSPTGEAILIAASEESETLSAFQIGEPGPAPSASMLLGENGFTADAIFTVGETFANGYTPPGVIDGLGAMELDANTVRVFANHELLNFDGYAYELENGTELTGARISFFDIDKTSKQIIDSGLAYDTIYDANGNEVTDTNFLSLPGFGGLSRLCSSILFEADTFGAGRGLVDTIYFSGEEDGGGFNAVGGAEWALDVETGELWALPAFGRGAWENVTQIDTGTTTHVAFILSDDTSPFDVDADDVDEAAPLYLYVGEKSTAGDAGFVERNGLADGDLFVWVPDDAAKFDPESFTGVGTSQPGSWVPVDNSPNLAMASADGSTGFDQFGYPTQRNLWEQAEAEGAFQFSRPEDVATNPNNGSEFVLASTGRQNDFNGADLVGELYTMDVAFDFTGGTFNGATGSLEILYDGDADAAQTLRSPDNLDWADDGLIYVQEDRAVGGIFGDGAVNPNEAGIVRIDPAVVGGAPERIANIDRSAVPSGQTDEDPEDIGDWESSGILDVSTLFDEAPGSLFIANVQAHGIDDQDRFVIHGSGARITDGDLKEGGQLLFLSTDTPRENSFTLQLLHLADGEAGLLASQTAPNLAALVDAFEDDYVNSITLAGGDNFIPGPFLAAGADPSVEAVLPDGNTQGRIDIEIHNALGVQASTIGNHEFDLGSRGLREVIGSDGDYTGSVFPYLSANLDFSGDGDLSGFFEETIGDDDLEMASALANSIVPSAVIEENGEYIGIVGATTQVLASISSPSGTIVKGSPADDDMALLAQQLQPYIDDLIAQGVNKIIVMSHLQQIENEIALAPLLEGVDIILAAGSNTRLGDADDVAVAFSGHAADFADTYPIVTAGSDGAPTLIVNTDNEYTYLGRLVVEFDGNGEIIVDRLDDLVSVNGAYAATEDNVAQAWGTDVANLDTTAFAAGTRGERVAELVGAAQDVIDVKSANVFGFSDVYLEGARASVRSEETNLGNLTADANAAAARDALGLADDVAVVAIKNGGGIRAQIGTVSGVGDDVVFGPNPNGEVSQLDVENSLRFNNGLITFQSTPEELLNLLNTANATSPGSGGFLQVSGLELSYDPDQPAGSRIMDVALVDANGAKTGIVDDGVVLASAPAEINVVILDFTARQDGDGYQVAENGTNFRYILPDGTLSAPLGTIDNPDDPDPANILVDANSFAGDTLGEQQALADYLGAMFGTPETAFDMPETPQSVDERIQNQNERTDTVLDGAALPPMGLTIEMDIEIAVATSTFG